MHHFAFKGVLLHVLQAQSQVDRVEGVTVFVPGRDLVAVAVLFVDPLQGSQDREPCLVKVVEH
jgi:hypothetical protein